MNRLFISDLDGTLLQKNASLSPFAIEHLCSMLRQGLPFSVATGRSVVSIREILIDLPISLPVIGSNGAFVSDFQTGHHQCIHAIEPSICQEVWATIHQHGFSPFVTSFDGREDRLYFEHIRNKGMRWYEQDRRKARDRRLRQAGDWKAVLREQVISFNLIEPQERIRELYEVLEETFGERLRLHVYDNEFAPGWCWFAIQDAQATKAKALEVLADMLGYEVNQLTVFGDNLNDLSMFHLVPECIAVENAHPSLKALASKIIGSHEQDSVVDYLLQNW